MCSVARSLARERLDVSGVDVKCKTSDWSGYPVFVKNVPEPFDDAFDLGLQFLGSGSPLDVSVELCLVFRGVVGYDVLSWWQGFFVSVDDVTHWFV